MKPITIDPTMDETARRCLINDLKRTKKRRSRKRRYSQASNTNDTQSQMPWNRGWPTELHLCESVRAMLPYWSKYHREPADK